MNILLIILILIILLKLIAKVKEGNVILVFANIGAGKTTYLAKRAKKEQKKIKRGKSKYDTIISNTPISGCLYVPDIKKILNNSTPENTLYLLDEGELIWNNRKMKMTDKEIEYVKLIRHYNSKMIIVSQSSDDIDITVRRIYTNLYLLNKYGSLTLIRPIRKFITIDKETEQIKDGYAFRSILSWGIMNRKRYYSMFDTMWVPDGRVHPDYTPYTVIEYKKKEATIVKIAKKFANMGVIRKNDSLHNEVESLQNVNSNSP